MAHVAVVGATSWGATLSWLLAKNGHTIALLCRDADEAAQIAISRRVARATTLELPDAITPHHEPAAALADAAAVVIVVPAQSIRENARRLSDALSPGTLVVHATKGLERGTALRVSEMLLEEMPQIAPNDVCALSGPNLAPEIQRGLPAATVIAGNSATSVAGAQMLFHQTSFRVYASDDLVGVELAGALKNVVAIVAGIADGLGAGDNAKAGIITRGIAEIARLGAAAGASASTFSGLAGAGDVMATSYSPLSRNRRTGEAIGRGDTVASAIEGAGGVVEGVEATAAACTLAERLHVDMPIAFALRDVLFEGARPVDVIPRLLEREAARESQ